MLGRPHGSRAMPHSYSNRRPLIDSDLELRSYDDTAFRSTKNTSGRDLPDLSPAKAGSQFFESPKNPQLKPGATISRQLR